MRTQCDDNQDIPAHIKPHEDVRSTEFKDTLGVSPMFSIFRCLLFFGILGSRRIKSWRYVKLTSIMNTAVRLDTARVGKIPPFPIYSLCMN